MPRKGGIRVDPRARHGGFNEAGAFMPRKACPVGPSRQPWRCFNEAGAFMPRKALAGLRTLRTLARFNEAGAFMPRKDAITLWPQIPIPALQ